MGFTLINFKPIDLSKGSKGLRSNKYF